MCFSNNLLQIKKIFRPEKKGSLIGQIGLILNLGNIFKIIQYKISVLINHMKKEELIHKYLHQDSSYLRNILIIAHQCQFFHLPIN